MLYSIKLFLTGKYPLSDIYYFTQGNLRYKLFYSYYFNFLIRNHIYQQIEYRIKIMNKECYDSGSCIKCGCKTTELQMCNKSCKGNCYPKMMNKRQWNKYKLDYGTDMGI